MISYCLQLPEVEPLSMLFVFTSKKGQRSALNQTELLSLDQRSLKGET